MTNFKNTSPHVEYVNKEKIFISNYQQNQFIIVVTTTRHRDITEFVFTLNNASTWADVTFNELHVSILSDDYIPLYEGLRNILAQVSKIENESFSEMKLKSFTTLSITYS